MSTPVSPVPLDTLLAEIASLLKPGHREDSSHLLTGNAGVALFFAYLQRYQPTEEHEGWCHEHVDSAVAATSKAADLSPYFSIGVAGLSWTISHLLSLKAVPEEVSNIVDELRPLIEQFPGLETVNRSFDLFTGLIGTAVSLLEDTGADHHATLETIVGLIAGLAVKQAVGIAWPTPYKIPGTAGYNLGLAHGTPSVILFLLLLHERGIAAERCRQLIYDAVAFMLTQYRPAGSFSFSHSSTTEEERQAPASSRMAWCFGDLGISYMLLRVGAHFSDANLKATGLKVALRSCERDLADSMVAIDSTSGQVDIGFCHGTAGIAFLYKQLHELTGHPRLQDRVRYWLGLTTQHLPPFLTQLRHDSNALLPGTRTAEDSYSLIFGLAGVGLVLLSFLNPAVSGWERIFLLDNKQAAATYR